MYSKNFHPIPKKIVFRAKNADFALKKLIRVVCTPIYTVKTIKSRSSIVDISTTKGVQVLIYGVLFTLLYEDLLM